MKIQIFVVLMLAVAAKQIAADKSCHLREMDLCMAIGIFHYQGNGVPSDEEKVNEWCETLKEVGDCAGNFTNKCMSPLQKELVSLFSQGSESAASQFCTQGSEIRTNYLKYAECLAEASENDAFKNHMKDLQVAIETVFDSKFKDRLPTLCCGFRRFDEGIEKNTRENCGEEAIEMAHIIMSMMSTDLPSVICQTYDPKSSTCQRLLPVSGTPPKGSESKSQIGRLLGTVFGNV
uniref:U20-Liphistoxin-Lm1a_1 n=1 Tax=Liphistius malayanus TaxID=1203467 RepID=A0A482Z8I9_9ARAC